MRKVQFQLHFFLNLYPRIPIALLRKSGDDAGVTPALNKILCYTSIAIIWRVCTL